LRKVIVYIVTGELPPTKVAGLYLEYNALIIYMRLNEQFSKSSLQN